MSLEQDLYFISVAARMLGMHPQTLRKYERLGLVQPTRTIGSMRLYSRDELERLRLIKRLVDDAGINLAGVQRLLSIAEVVQRIRPLMRDEALGRARRAAAPDAGARRAQPHAGVRLAMEFKDYYSTLGVAKTATGEGDQAGVPEAGAQAPPGRQPGRQGRRDALQGDQRGLRGARRSRRSARSTTSSAPTGGCTSRRAPARRRPAGRRLERRLRRRRRAAAGRLPHDDGRRDAGDVRRRRSRSPTSSTRSSAARWAARSRGAAARRRARPRAAQGARRRAGDRARRSRTPTTARCAAWRSSTTATRAPSTCGFRPASATARACASPARASTAAGGAQSGDLYLRIRLAPHPTFDAQGQGSLHARRHPAHDGRARRRGGSDDARREAAPAEDPADDAERAGVPAEGPRHAGGRQSRTSTAISTPRSDVAAPPLADAGASASTSRRCRAGEAGTSRVRVRSEPRSIMNINKYTEKAQEAVAAAQQLAERDEPCADRARAPARRARRTEGRHRPGAAAQDVGRSGRGRRARRASCSARCRRPTAARSRACRRASSWSPTPAQAEADRLKDEFVSTEHLLRRDRERGGPLRRPRSCSSSAASRATGSSRRSRASAGRSA